MASFNRVIILGNLCKDPELRKTPTGMSVVDIRMAVNEVYKNRTTGERTEKTNFVDVVVWDRQAEVCHQYLAKGSPLLVEGRLSYDEWKNQQGETRSRLRVTADRIQLVGQRPQGTVSQGTVSQGTVTQGTQGTVPQSAASVAQPAVAEPESIPEDPMNDDPPF